MTDTPPTCPVELSGTWQGSWSSQRVIIGGNATAMVAVSGSSISGTLELTGPEGSNLIDSGAITGSVDCLSMELSVADDSLTLDGTLTPEGTAFTGSYNVSLNGGAIEDYGTFLLTRR